MSTYKLIYFNAKGRAEVSRFILAQAGVQYEDKRITSEEWAELKPTTVYGTIPVLEVDGKQLAGAQVIARFLAERFGLAGSNDFENADIAGLNDVIFDLGLQIVKIWHEKDESRRAPLKKELGETHLPRYLGILEKRAQSSGAPEGWLWGELTWTDFNFYQILEFLQLEFLQPMDPDVLKSYPTLTTLKASVESLPNISKWLKERPQTL